VVSVPVPAPAPATSPAPFRAEATATAPAAQSIQPDNSGSVPVPAHGGQDLAALWTALVEAVGRASPFTRTYLLDAHPVSFSGRLFIIGFDPEFQDHIGLIDNARNHTLLQTKLAELGHADIQFKFVKAEDPARARREDEPAPAPLPAPKQAPQPPPSAKPAASAPASPAKNKSNPVAFSKEDFKNDALIQKALEIFKGQIVEVRA
jgi:DNA polymerase-3 subunit gamma/tau